MAKWFSVTWSSPNPCVFLLFSLRSLNRSTVSTHTFPRLPLGLRAALSLLTFVFLFLSAAREASAAHGTGR